MKRFYLCIVFLFVGLTNGFSQDCDCDHYVSVDAPAFDGSGVLPGEVICVESGFRGRLKLKNIVGTSTEPITVKNCGGLVMIDASGQPFGLRIESCDYMRFTGTGSDADLLGFAIDGSFGNGIKIDGLSNHFEIDHVDITNINGPAIFNREEPRCDLSANEGYYTLEDCHLHDLAISNSKEGIVIGHPNFRIAVVEPFCGGLFPYAIENLTVSNVDISEISDGCGIELYGCQGAIANSRFDDINGVGVLLGMECDMKVVGNRVHACIEHGLKGEGTGIYDIYNNIFSSNGEETFESLWFEFFYPEGGAVTNSLQFLHNTVVGSGDFNLFVANSLGATTDCHVENNIFCESGHDEPSDLEFAPHLNFEETDLFTIGHNSLTATRGEQNFAGFDDFNLSHDSPAINVGFDHEISSDFKDDPRNLAGAPDAGAFEYVPESIAYFGSIPLVGLYVDDFKNILGDPEAETELLEFAQDNHFNYLLLYNLAYIHSHTYDLEDADEAIVLANFIERAKKDYGIVQMGAVGEKNASFDKIEVFNALYGDSWFQKFDVLNLEFEFWTDPGSAVFSYYCDTYLEPGGYPCTNEGAYDFYEGEIADIDTRAHAMGIISEIYLGYTSEEESIGLAERCDRILLHHYRTTDVYGDGSSIYNYHTYRIRDIALSDRKPAVMPIFSSRSYHMGPWLMDHSLHQPMDTWLNGEEGYYEDDSPGVSELPISGHQWYRYTSFLDILPSFAPEHGGEVYAVESSDIQLRALGNETVAIEIPNDQPNEQLECEVYNVQGQLLQVYALSNGYNAIQIDQASGVYLGVVKSAGVILKTEKLIYP